MMMRVLAISSLAVFILAVVVVSFYSDVTAQQQSGFVLPSEIRELPKIETDLEAALFPNNKKGCTMKLNFLLTMIRSFDEGQSPEDVADFKIMEPFLRKYFDKVQAQGMTQISLDAMREYQSCVETSKPVSNPQQELVLTSRHASCTKLTNVIFGTLDGIKGRQSLETILARHGKADIDFMDTGFEKITFGARLETPQTIPEGTFPEGMDREILDPIHGAMPQALPNFITAMYEAGKEDSFDAAVAAGSMLLLTCVNGR